MVRYDIIIIHLYILRYKYRYNIYIANARIQV